MKGLVRRRERIVRVRRVQHLQVAAAAAQAEGRALQLETTSDRLRDLRGSLAATPGVTFGAALANVNELGARLEKVRDGLTDAIVGARATAAEQAALRLAARIREESAVRLKERSDALWAADRERRLSRIAGRRPVRGDGA
ncbi:hypothetical protein [Sphingomonas montana]|uniref:hypothetical protein n=1 Tax=Sphingomonas montana TaxID=1843236 RepID=UPI00096C1D66|nr:hypothetical protein [Sphingomonas montana]